MDIAPQKYTIHVKTGDYEFIETEWVGTEEEAIACFQSLKTASQGGEGIPDKEMDRFLDEQLGLGTVQNGTEIYSRMNKEQQAWVQRIKRCLKRIEAKNK